MSGHSKWAKIKHQKGANDAKRGTLFTKLGKAITLAAQEGGGDADMNFTLRLAIEKAKSANMPTDNIERAVKRGTGDGEGGAISRIVYEGVGPLNSAYIVVSSTDNKNRTVADIRKLFEQGGGSLGASGSVMWQFEELGVITLHPAKLKKSEKFGKEDEYVPVDIDELEMELLDIEGIRDIQNDGEELVVTTEKVEFNNVHKTIEKMEIKIEGAGLEYIPKDELKLEGPDQERILKLMELFDEHDDVESVFCNINLG